MAGGIGIEFDLRGRRREKNQQDLELMKDLLDKGYSADAAKYILDKRNQTGELDLGLPNYKNTLQQGDQPNRPVALPPTGDVPERSTLKDFGPMKKKGFIAIDDNNPPKTRQDIIDSMIPVPDEYSSVTPITFNKKENGMDIYVDAATGREIRREPNGTKANKTIKVGSSTPGTKDSAATKTALDYMKGYYKSVREGTADPEDPMLPSFAASLGLGVNEIPSIENPAPSPSFMQKVFGIEPKAPPPTPAKTYPVVPGKGTQPVKDPVFTDPVIARDVEEAKAAVAKGLVSEEEAHKRLVNKHGNKIPPL